MQEKQLEITSVKNHLCQIQYTKSSYIQKNEYTLFTKERNQWFKLLQ